MKKGRRVAPAAFGPALAVYFASNTRLLARMQESDLMYRDKLNRRGLPIVSCLVANPLALQLVVIMCKLLTCLTCLEEVFVAGKVLASGQHFGRYPALMEKSISQTDGRANGELVTGLTGKEGVLQKTAGSAPLHGRRA